MREVKITKKKFKRMYETMKNEDIAKSLGVSEYYVIKFVKEFKLKRKARGHHKVKAKLVCM